MKDLAARRARALLARMRGQRVVVAGDLVADEFLYGRIDRVSREAPVLILRYDAADVVPGGAGNAAANVRSLGGVVDIVGVAGRDEAGNRLVASLSAGRRQPGIVRPPGFATPVKTRILAGGVHSAKQQVVRIDRSGTPIDRRTAGRVESALARALGRARVLVVSDYGSGLLSPAVLSRALARARRRHPPLVLVDSRYRLGEFRGATACTPNESEVEALYGVRIGDDMAMLERCGRDLLARLGAKAVLVTRGSRGMALFEPGRPADHIGIVGSDQIVDVTGAGDTVIAAFALALAAGAPFGAAARLANHAGAAVVMKRGTAQVTPADLLETWA